ncbi:MAG: carboxymuconolactone decarboxylase family protein [Burkholderiaceae bacterium]|nr:carboxymuconolactone decarboxylase family protein [Burkholderiaceae bacterium]
MPNGKSFREHMRHNGKYVTKFQKYHAKLNEAFWTVNEEAMKDGALDRKTKELIALALVVSKHCDVCITFHVRDCLKHGCTEAEIMEALGVAVMEGDGPTMVYAGNALEALEEYQQGKSQPGRKKESESTNPI